MVRRPFSNPYCSGIPDDESPVIDPASIYQADPEINFDNVKRTPEAPGPDHAARHEGTESGKSIPEHLREARTASESREAQTVPEECPRCAEAEKARLLALADLENARKRLAREKEEFIKFAGESILADILPALDNLDLALAYAPQGKECLNFVVGVDMTRKLLLDTLAKHGLQQVGELGETFDPAKHEAVEMQPSSEYQSGQVCGLLSKGYLLKDRLIRPAKVRVCKNE